MFIYVKPHKRVIKVIFKEKIIINLFIESIKRNLIFLLL